MRKVLVFYAILCVLFVSAAQASVLSGPIVNPSNNHQYYLLSDSTWTDAEASSVTLGGHLATVRNEAENDWILAEFTDLIPAGFDKRLWIGLYDPVGNDGTGAQHAANFVWVSGELATYRNWGVNEPSNAGGGENYTQLFAEQGNEYILRGNWNDTYNTDWGGHQNFGVVEVVPEPATLFLITLGGLFLRKRK